MLQESRVSTIWCEGQEREVQSSHCFEISMTAVSHLAPIWWLDRQEQSQELKMVSNGSTFNAYLLEERPKLRRVRQLVSYLVRVTAYIFIHSDIAYLGTSEM